MGASKELYMRIQEELNYQNLQYEVLNSYEEEQRIKENNESLATIKELKKNYEKIQYSKLRKIQKRSEK